MARRALPSGKNAQRGSWKSPREVQSQRAKPERRGWWRVEARLQVAGEYAERREADCEKCEQSSAEKHDAEASATLDEEASPVYQHEARR